MLDAAVDTHTVRVQGGKAFTPLKKKPNISKYPAIYFLVLTVVEIEVLLEADIPLDFKATNIFLHPRPPPDKRRMPLSTPWLRFSVTKSEVKRGCCCSGNSLHSSSW